MPTRNFILIAIFFSCSLVAFAQGPQYTSNSADQTLRSNGRVNPSSLGLEIEIPLAQYRSRGISLPLGLSYSSKQWRLEEFRTVLDQHNYNHTWVTPRYSEDAAAGWTSSLSQPYIEYTGEKYRFDDRTSSEGAARSLDEILPPNSTPPGNTYMKRITVHLPGASHELIAQDAPTTDGISGDGPPDESVWDTTFYATDGSGLRYVQTPGSGLYRLYMSDGSFYDFNSTRESKNSVDEIMMVRRAYRLTDVHGNYVQFNAPDEENGFPNGSWTDQLGRTFPIMIPRETPTLETEETVKVQEFTLPGMDEPYVLKWKRLKGADQSSSAFFDYANRETSYPGAYQSYGYTGYYSPALFGGTGPTYTCGHSPQNIRATTYDGKFNPVVLTDVILPNGASYKFNYNEFGEIERIYYPAGGYEKITYEEVPSLAELKDLYTDTNRGVTVRDVFENENDSTPDTWTYSAASSANNYRTSVIAPDGIQTDRFMHRGIPPPSCGTQGSGIYYGTKWGYDNVFAGMQYDERVFSSSDAIVSRTLTRWGATTTANVDAVPRPIRATERAGAVDGSYHLRWKQRTVGRNGARVRHWGRRSGLATECAALDRIRLHNCL